MTKSKILASALVTASVMASAGPAFAAPASTSTMWAGDCAVAVVKANKDISNIVFRINGVDTKIEFKDGTYVFLIPGAATDIWVKSGNNASGDGPGYGERYQRPASCAQTTSSTTTATTVIDEEPDYTFFAS